MSPSNSWATHSPSKHARSSTPPFWELSATKHFLSGCCNCVTWCSSYQLSLLLSMPMIPGFTQNSSNTPQWWWASTPWCTRAWSETGSHSVLLALFAYSLETFGFTKKCWLLPWQSILWSCLHGLALCSTYATTTKMSMECQPATNSLLGGISPWQCFSSLVGWLLCTCMLGWSLIWRLVIVRNTSSSSKVKSASLGSASQWLHTPACANCGMRRRTTSSTDTTTCMRSMCAPILCAPIAKIGLTSLSSDIYFSLY